MFEGGPTKCYIHGKTMKDGHVDPYVVEFPVLDEKKLVKKDWRGNVIGLNEKYMKEFDAQTLAKVREWDKHCVDFKHKIDVRQICHHCYTPNVFFDMPYPESMLEKTHTGGSGIVLTCAKCKKPCI